MFWKTSWCLLYRKTPSDPFYVSSCTHNIAFWFHKGKLIYILDTFEKETRNLKWVLESVLKIMWHFVIMWEISEAAVFMDVSQNRLQLYWKSTPTQVFPVNFTKCLRKAFSKNTSEWVILNFEFLYKLWICLASFFKITDNLLFESTLSDFLVIVGSDNLFVWAGLFYFTS